MTPDSQSKFLSARFSALALLGAVPFLNGDSLDVASLSLDELMAVEVTTPGKVPEAIRDTPASVYLVGREDIETFGYASLTEVFENIPGFYNIDNYNGVSGNFGVRGYWNGRSQNSSVAILVNGVPQMRQDLFSTPMEGLGVPVESIDRIEISRGPNSVIYGNGAFFGAINIITDDSYSDDQVSVSYGARGTTRAAGRWSVFGEDYHVIFNAGYSESDGYDYDLLDLASPARAALLPAFGVEPGNTSLEGRLEQRTEFLQMSAAWKGFYFDYSLNQAGVETFTGFPAVADGNLRSTDNARIVAGIETPLGDLVNLDTRLTYNSFSSREDYDALFEGFIGVNTRDFDNWELESLLTYTPNDKLRFLGGVNLQRLQNFFESTHIPDLGLFNESVVIDERDIRSLFGQVSYQLSKPWTMVAGYRVEKMLGYDRFVFVDEPLDGTPLPGGPKGGFENGTPRASLIYQPSESQVLKLMIGDATKIPNFNDPGFESERSRTSEVNYTWSSESLIFSAGIFRNTLRNLLIQALDFEPSGLIDTDLLKGGRVETNGLEVLLIRDFSDEFRAEIGFTMQESDSMETPQGRLSYSPDLLAHAKVSYKRDDVSASLLGRYVDDMLSFYNIDEEATPILKDGYFGDAVGSYFVVDLNLRWDNVWEGLYLNAHINNVFDTEIRYPNNPINGLLLDRGNIGPGRGLTLKAGIRF
ncbi:TonB-dependent receptor [Pelagicoccus sp. SDUM812002]|uniref:TonB-dependent receptor plug domain-containing protein n=1 Tax=Pelagicoccus sp. SDUM812002 TaxID=3041266 RepID=UPI00280FA080|nr:TonB-dependent receptor [Pelagicoccus sp. SDUM812002]MDQ8184890.1 TonB-dependent receptor [Pelagicoccus sp. SDUM812002]